MDARPCAYCGEPFKPREARIKYCKPACFYAARRAAPRPLRPQRPCAQCGKLFTVRQAEDKYCTRRCYWDSEVTEPVSRTCVGCGTVFTVRYQNTARKYCTPTCRLASTARPP